MERQQLAELAHLYATEGLEGESLAAFEAWRETAAPEEMAEFAALVDAVAAVTLAHVPEAQPSADVKSRLLEAVGRGDDQVDSPEEPLSYLLRDEGEWIALPVPGTRLRELSARKSDGVTVFLLEMDPDTTFPSHRHHGVEMTYLLEGDLHTDQRVLQPGDFVRAGVGSQHRKLYSQNGCRALLITASENFPRRSVGLMKRLQDVLRAARDLWGGRAKG